MDPLVVDRRGLPFRRAADGVVVGPHTIPFSYSDGRVTEVYLAHALQRTGDLSSTSVELEQWIKDWPTEYHLSCRRGDLLRGFSYRPGARVLEVGCGCGAITRFLGEMCDSVTAVEGSRVRAHLARLRTRDQEHVEILCSPLHEVVFDQPFDLIVCVGVLEYARMFVPGEDPYEAMVEYCAANLTKGGALVVAIENQFGLKYFAGAREDHTNVVSDGLEGYPRWGEQTRTFSYPELRERLMRHFQHVKFYYPYPDYKLPRCVLSERAFQHLQLGEVVGAQQSNARGPAGRPHFDEALVALELGRVGRLPFFSNSFLVTASTVANAFPFPQLGILHSRRRRGPFNTVTRFLKDDRTGGRVQKTLQSGQLRHEEGGVAIKALANEWCQGLSVHAQVLRLVKRRDVSLEEILKPAVPWLAALQALATRVNGRLVLPGQYFDAVWKNAFVIDGEVRFVDLEWDVTEPLELSALVVRALYWFLDDIEGLRDLGTAFRVGPRIRRIKRLGQTLGMPLPYRSFMSFTVVESRVATIGFGMPQRIARIALAVSLRSTTVVRSLQRLRPRASRWRQFAVALKARALILLRRLPWDIERP